MFLAVILALVAGVCLGLLGGGGSILIVPILRYVLGLEGHAAIAMSLLVVAATSAAALVSHARRGRVQWRTGLVFGGAGMLGAYAGGRVAHFVPSALLVLGFGVMMFGTAIAMLRPERRPSSAPTLRAARPRSLPIRKVLVEGLVVGAVTGLVGAGGGFLVVPALVLRGRLPMDVAVATSLLVIMLKSFAGFAGFLGHTALDWSLVAAITGASVLGSWGGAALAPRISVGTLRRSFGWFIIAMASFILAQELPSLFGREPQLVTAVSLALVVSAGLYAVSRRLQRSGSRLPEAASLPPPPRAGANPHSRPPLRTSTGK